MARIFVRRHPSDPRNCIVMSDTLPSKSDAIIGKNYVEACPAFTEEVGIMPSLTDMKGGEIVEFDVTVKEVGRYKLVQESPWKPVTKAATKNEATK